MKPHMRMPNLEHHCEYTCMYNYSIGQGHISLFADQCDLDLYCNCTNVHSVFNCFLLTAFCLFSEYAA